MLKKIIVFIIVSMLCLYAYGKISSKSFYSERYLKYYNIEFIDPLKSKRLFKEGIKDPMILARLLYDNKQIEILLQNDYYKPMRPLVVKYYIDYKFMNLLNDEKQEELRKIINELDLYKEENYYAYFENKRFMQNTLIIVDPTNNFVYTLDSY